MTKSFKIGFLLFLFIIISCKKDTIRETAFSLTLIDNCNYFDVVLVAGQSNTYSGYPIDTFLDKPNPRIMQLGRWNKDNYRIIEAKEPLQHHDFSNDGIGFAMTFAKNYISNELLGEARKILLIHCGKGGTGFHSNYWNRGNILYNDAVERTRSVLKSGKGNKLIAILWHQGENDIGMDNYQQVLDHMIFNMRNDIDSTQSIPFITGGMVPLWVAQNPTRLKQQEIIANAQYRVSFVGYADPNSPFRINDSNPNELIHYSAKGQREMGRRYFEAYLNVKNINNF